MLSCRCHILSDEAAKCSAGWWGKASGEGVQGQCGGSGGRQTVWDSRDLYLILIPALGLNTVADASSPIEQEVSLWGKIANAPLP